MIENRAVGIKSREVYEAPAAIVLIGALRARGRRADEGRGADQARARAALDRARLRRALVQPRPRGDRRVRRQDPGARRRGRPPSCARTPPSSPAAARRTCSTPSARSAAPARRSPTPPPRGFIEIASLEVERRRPQAGEDRGMSLGRGGSGARSIPPSPPSFAQTTPSCCRTTAKPRRCTPGASTPRVCSTTPSSPRQRRGWPRSPGRPIEPEDEDVHTAIERLLGAVGRKIHAGRSRNDQVAAAFRLYVADAAAEARAAVAALGR